MEENIQTMAMPPSEAQNAEIVKTSAEIIQPVAEQNGNCNQSNANRNNANAKNNNRNNNFNVKNKKLNNRRRKRSFRSRKNSRSGNNFKFNAKSKKRDLLFDRDQVRRHQLFFTDSQRLVPYNTNEFLMEDHFPKISPNFNYNPINSHDSFSSSDCGMSGSIDEDEFLTKEFRMDYENLRSEQLNDMTKDQLIQEYLKLENQTELSIKAKENEILALNNKIKGGLVKRADELTRRLKHEKNTKQKLVEGDQEYSSHSDSSSSDSDSSSSDSSSSSSDSNIENEENDVNYPVITEQPPQIAETVSC
ncbi:CLUMA_CG005989, isoform A [Clunio marinus]|uniref:CLUMA_CG005989, isoform A n=1 Tax=Clunio marinus TaxID=568069 RepID=A0A1J1HYJ0_9DIPT|nr:CLUMA_CG005989, isoform A [Clunio marinus]